MYSLLLATHSALRWVVLILGLLAFGRALTGWLNRRGWSKADDSGAKWFNVSLDVQFLIGLVLYVFLSPFTSEAFKDFGAAMRDPFLRFFAVEHVAGMFIAIALAHVGRSKLRKLTDNTKRHRTAAIFFGLALLAIALSIPWPGMPAGRPLLRGLSSIILLF